METRQPQAKAIVEQAGFKFFLDSLWLDNMDRMAMIALSELWWDTTNTFHFRFGEMTMTPLDFTMITGLPIGGQPLAFYEEAHADEEYLQNLLGVENVPLTKRGVRRSWLYNYFSIQSEEDGGDPEDIARAFILYLLSCTFFAGTQDIAPLGFLKSLEDMDNVHLYDWGGAALATMYRSMCDKSRDAAQDFGGLAFIWQVWAFIYLGLGCPLLKEGVNQWPFLARFDPCHRKHSNLHRYDYAAAKAILAGLTAEQVNWDPWGTWRTTLAPPHMHSVLLTHRRILFEGPAGRYWYLGERVCRQVYGNMDAARVPFLPPANMRHTDKLKGEALLESKRGVDLSAFLFYDASYEVFCQQFLMRPLATGEPPERSRRSRGQSSRAAVSDDDQETNRPPALQPADWNIELIVEDNFVTSTISRPSVDEGYHIDPSYEQVPREYCQDYIDLTTAMRRDLRRMSLRTSALTRQQAPDPPRHSSAGEGSSRGIRRNSRRR